MPKPVIHDYVKAKDAPSRRLTINPDAPHHKGRFIIYRDGPLERGHPRAIGSTKDEQSAHWIVERLRIAEKHEPDTPPIPYGNRT